MEKSVKISSQFWALSPKIKILIAEDSKVLQPSIARIFPRVIEKLIQDLYELPERPKTKNNKKESVKGATVYTFDVPALANEPPVECTLILAPDGEVAKNMFVDHNGDFDFVLFDEEMPNKIGSDALQEIFEKHLQTSRCAHFVIWSSTASLEEKITKKIQAVTPSSPKVEFQFYEKGNQGTIEAEQVETILKKIPCFAPKVEQESEETLEENLYEGLSKLFSS